jgi:hypothetical protein
MKPIRESGASSVLLNEFMNSSFLDPLGSVVQVHVDFTVGVLNNYSMIEKTYGCIMPKSQTSQFVHEAVSAIEKLNPTGLNTTKIEEQDRAVFCGHLAFSINCIGFDYESCLSKILLPMQTDGLLPFRNTRRCDSHAWVGRLLITLLFTIFSHIHSNCVLSYTSSQSAAILEFLFLVRMALA